MTDFNKSAEKELEISVKIDEQAECPSILNVALISDSNKLLAQVNGDDTKDVSLKVRLAEESFVLLVYPIWKKDYDRETDVTVEMRSSTNVPVPSHELGYDTMDDSVGWAKLV